MPLKSARTRCALRLFSLLTPWLVLLAVGTSRARADEFVMPFGGYLSVQLIGGEAAGVTTFGLGTSPGDFVPLLMGIPNSPSSRAAINAGFFAAGTTVHFGMLTTFSGSGWAFSDGMDQASLVAFSDTDNSLGLGGSVIEHTSTNTWTLHLDDAMSFLIDDDDNDVLIQLRITDQPVATVPEPPTGPLMLASSTLAGWKLRRRLRERARNSRMWRKESCSP